MEPVIQEGHERNVHHMTLYECHVPVGEPSSQEIFEQYVGTENGVNCYREEMPDEFYYCMSQSTYVWVMTCH